MRMQGPCTFMHACSNKHMSKHTLVSAAPCYSLHASLGYACRNVWEHMQTTRHVETAAFKCGIDVYTSPHTVVACCHRPYIGTMHIDMLACREVCGVLHAFCNALSTTGIVRKDPVQCVSQSRQNPSVYKYIYKYIPCLKYMCTCTTAAGCWQVSDNNVPAKALKDLPWGAHLLMQLSLLPLNCLQCSRRDTLMYTGLHFDTLVVVDTLVRLAPAS